MSKKMFRVSLSHQCYDSDNSEYNFTTKDGYIHKSTTSEQYVAGRTISDVLQVFNDEDVQHICTEEGNCFVTENMAVVPENITDIPYRK